MRYLPRVIDRVLEARLMSMGAVVIEGPKACGKTRTAEENAASAVHLDTNPSALEAIAIDPGLILDGPTPRLIDEWQLASTAVWNHVRSEVDRRGVPGQFILTGSSVPDDDVRRHSGAGRFARLTMRPMSLYESGDSTGEISLASLLDGNPQRAPDPGLTIRRIAELIVRGGWPLQLELDSAAALQAGDDYLTNICEVDLPRLEGAHPGPRRDPQRLRRLLAAVARNVATEAGPSRLAADADPDQALARSTVYDYLDALRRLLIIEPQHAWATHLRSRAQLRTADKLHFVDPSLAAAALQAGPTRLLSDLRFLGFLFESLVVRDTRVFADALGAAVHHYRDSNGLEIDLVVQATDGRWGAIEVKLGAARVDEAATALGRFARTVDTSRVGEPAFLAVITGAGYGYRRPDGIDVIPVGAWGP